MKADSKRGCGALRINGMIRRLLLFVALFAAASAQATWNPSFSSRSVDVTVGETTTIQLRAVWSGFSYYPNFSRWTCVSTRGKVAHVEGSLTSPGSVADIRITGVSPGHTWLAIEENSWRYVEIFVYPRPVSVSITPSAAIGTVGRPLTLSAITEGSPHTLRWYSGRIGDLSHPLEGGANDVTVKPVTVGTTYYWVSAIGDNGAASDEIAIDVKPAPRQRGVRH
jgi:hypothetical protein